MSIVEVKTQTTFMVLLPIWVTAYLGETLRCLTWCVPQVFVCHLLSINYIPLFFYRNHTMMVYAFFLQK